jgi:hydroxymethylpyrimidine pyrophosphatase-like HAD family hydrolase
VYQHEIFERSERSLKWDPLRAQGGKRPCARTFAPARKTNGSVRRRHALGFGGAPELSNTVSDSPLWRGPSSGIVDLLLPFETMAALLHRSLRGGTARAGAAAHASGWHDVAVGRNDRERAFDAFLLAAGMNQIVEDYLHRDVFSLGKVASRVEEIGGPLIGALAARSALLTRAVGISLRKLRPSHRRVRRMQAELASFVSLLAKEVACQSPQSSGATEAGELLTAADNVLERVARWPRPLRESVVRLAQCFRSFDQRPEDCRRLARLLAARFPDRQTPILVVGLRTSGSYLAPLQSAMLELDGYSNVAFMTLRPGHELLAREVERVTDTARAGGLVCVVDDPPRTGLQLAAATETLLSLGVPPQSLVLLVQLFGPPASLPAPLRKYQSIVLPWERWSIRESLSEKAVLETLRGLLPGRTLLRATGARWREIVVGAIDEVKNLPAPTRGGLPGRGHVGAVFRARLVDQRSGERVDHDVYVQGVGLGYLGRHTLAVASRVHTFLPQIYGLEGGLLYRAWLPDEWRLGASWPAGEAAVADRVASYVIARRETLAVPDDTSRRLRGRGPVWELVGEMLSDVFGRGKALSRPLTRRSARRLVRPTRASVVDGSMALSHWFAPPAQTDLDSMQKVDFAERAYSNEDMYCYDAVFDLACAAADYAATHPTENAALEFGDRLRELYESRTGETIENERWLLYQLLYHHWIGRRHYLAAVTRRDGEDQRGPADEVAKRPLQNGAANTPFSRLLAGRRAMALAHQRYFGDLFFADLTHLGAGPICAIDVDWVLESRWLGFPAISPTGALALRALLRHGCRPLIATGRSLGEVRARCSAYRLPGGVAEYGAVVYVHGSNRARSLLTGADNDELEALRRLLLEIRGVRLDPFHEHGIRAYRVDTQGRVSGLDETTIRCVLERHGGPEPIRAIAAPSQTDFVLAHIDKGRGLRALIEELDGDINEHGTTKLAFAIGDSASDLPMLALADRAFAPANADLQLRELDADDAYAIELVRRPAQAGLLLAVSAFLGHRPERCDVCAPPRPSSLETRMVLAALGALDGGRRARLRQALRLSALAMDPKA